MIRRNRLTILVLIAITVTGLLGTIPFTESYTGQKIAEYMSSPLPTAPEPVLQGDDFPVTVKDLSDSLAGGAASDWNGEISSMYGVYDLTLVNGTFDGEKWLLYFNVAGDVHVGLYNLTLTQGTGAAALSVHQSRCVWVLKEWPESITFTHVTDIHEPIGELVFPAFILQSNFINPDFVIATGDIVQTETNARAWAYLQYAMLHFENPTYLLPGNHDYSGYGGKIYAQYGGKLNYTLVLGDFVIIATDTDGIGYLDQDQLTWLENQLEKYQDKVKIIGFHHGLLSSEYGIGEGAENSMMGGQITASWEEIDELADTMYFTWKDAEENPLPEAQELMRLIQEYDVRVIVAGHVHRDVIYVVNNQHYFITTSTTGGGLPPTERYGSRLITLDNEGTVHLDPYAEASLEIPPNNLPTGLVSYTYSSANDFSGTAVSVSLENNLEMDINEGRLIFKVSKSKPLEDYVFVGEQPVRIETTTTSEGYVFDAYFDVEAQSGFMVTLKAADDNLDPEIWVELAEPYQSETSTLVTLSASDYGWGLKEMDVSYSVDDGATWTTVESTIEPILTGTLYKDTFPQVDIQFEVPALSERDTIIVKAEATDYAGNTADYQSPDLAASGPVVYTLSVDSEPISVEIDVDAVSVSTPYEEELAEGEHTISAPETVTVEGVDYDFQEWSTGSTSSEITITLSEDASITATYLEIETEEPEPEPDTGGGIPFPGSFVLIGVATAILVFRVRKPRVP